MIRGAGTDSTEITNPETQPAGLFTDRAWRITFLCVVFLLAVYIRGHRLTEPMLEFAATRNYFSALNARSMYRSWDPAIPEWQKHVAEAAALPFIEPPVMETTAAVLYRVTGGEHLWIPRLMSIIIWCIGGILLWAIALRLTSPDGALFSLAYYLLQPFAIVATRGFQPDPLMVALMLGGLLAILRYDTKGTSKRLLTAAIVCSVAVLVKPHCITFLACAFIGIAVLREGTRAARKSSMWTFLGIIMLPSAIYYGWNLLLSDSLTGPASKNFVPRNLLCSYYWQGWRWCLQDALGAPAILGVMLGCCCAVERKTRHFLASLWIGYFLYGLTFSGGIWSHSYYQLSAVAVAALSLGPAAAAVFSALSSICTSRRSRTILGVVLIVMLFLLAKQYRGLMYSPTWRAVVSSADEIGRVTDHTDKALLLSRNYGKPLMYYGNLAGTWWPDTGDLAAEARMGKPSVGAKERLDKMLKLHKSRYFIITLLDDYGRQSDLVDALARYRVTARTKDYLVVDLTHRQ